jgi:hypothetical protein
MNEELSSLFDRVDQMARVVVRYRVRRIILELFFVVLVTAALVFVLLDYLSDKTARNLALVILTFLGSAGLGAQIFTHVTVIEARSEGLVRRNIGTQRRKYEEIVAAFETDVGLIGEHQLNVVFQDNRKWIVSSSQLNYPEFMLFLVRMGVAVKSLSGVIEGKKKE